MNENTKRLDWLEENHWNVICRMPRNVHERPRWYVGADDAYTEVDGESIREAIDKLRLEHAKERDT